MIYLVRHGEAAASWGDHPDPGLSTLGQEQAADVSTALCRLGATTVISSPMQRCRETAAPFAEQITAPLEIVGAISEIETPGHVVDRVSWLRTLMQSQWPAEMTPWREGALEAVNALPDGTAVFSHFVAINAIVGKILDKEDVLIFKPGHCSITILERDTSGNLQVKALGQSVETKVL